MEISCRSDSLNIIGKSPAIQEVFEIVKKAAASDSTVIVFGESGTGKELIARALHFNSQRNDNPFVTVNCGAIPHDLLESELFGYEKGAFTGAMHTRVGRLELADRGTLFLDEIGDMPLALQVKLLRVLAEQEIDRIGGSKSIKIDVRIVAATHRNLEQEIQNGKFREDLFYRLNVIPIHMPPLRERKTDIPLLANYFLETFNKKRNKSVKGINGQAMDILVNYPWPGNIRELANYIERMVVLSANSVLTPRDLPEKAIGSAPKEIQDALQEPEPSGDPSEMLRQSMTRSFFIGLPEEGINLKQAVEDFERELIMEALERTDWVKNKAAILLGLNRTTLVEKLKKLNIVRQEQ
ncbi:MAG: sigma-54-dependent Fis family transcriptional regulator [Nitrospinae bacterium]|nr:sigma-54-dependent Fis family transcriptional regulator [Nitrospinota bacterium]